MTEKSDIPDEDALEDHLEDQTVKALLWEQNALLRGIYDRLAVVEEDTDRELWYCNQCDERMQESDVEEHMKEIHNAPVGIEYKATPFIEEL